MIALKIEPILCRTCGMNKEIKAVAFMALLDIDTHGERGSNERMMSEDIAQNLESFVYDCEGK